MIYLLFSYIQLVLWADCHLGRVLKYRDVRFRVCIQLDYCNTPDWWGIVSHSKKLRNNLLDGNIYKKNENIVVKAGPLEWIYLFKKRTKGILESVARGVKERNLDINLIAILSNHPEFAMIGCPSWCITLNCWWK